MLQNRQMTKQRTLMLLPYRPLLLTKVLLPEPRLLRPSLSAGWDDGLRALMWVKVFYHDVIQLVHFAHTGHLLFPLRAAITPYTDARVKVKGPHLPNYLHKIMKSAKRAVYRS